MELQEIEMPLLLRLNEAIELLRKKENSFMKFNMQVISSDMTDDEIYLKITGKNKNDFLLFKEKKEKEFLEQKEYLTTYIQNQISFCEDTKKIKKIAKILDFYLIASIKNQISICNDMDKLKKIAKILDSRFLDSRFLK